jgi:hypothetical protein
MDNKKNIINTFKTARKYTKLIKQKHQKLLFQVEYKKSADLLTSTKEYMEWRASFGEDSICSSPLASFQDRLNSGWLPTIESMWVISECFGRYFEAKGELELEEIFFGKPKKSQGNRSARRALEENELPLIHIHNAMLDKFIADANEPQMTDLEIVENIIKRYPNWSEKDPDSVLRTYRRKVKNPDSILRGFVKKNEK